MVLVGYWPLNEDSGNTALDYSGRDNNGDLTGITSGQSGILESFSYHVDQGGYLSLPAGSFPNYDFTISYWVKIEEDPNSSPQDRHYHVDLRGDGNQNNSQFAIFIDSTTSGNDSAEWNVWEEGNYLIQIEERYPVNEWVHVALTRKDGYYRLFLDSKQVATASGSGNSLTNSSSSHRWFNFSGDNTYTAEGNFLEIRYYDHALNSSEIQYLFSVSERGLQVTSKKNS